jgi:hypothetical protein
MELNMSIIKITYKKYYSSMVLKITNNKYNPIIQIDKLRYSRSNNGNEYYLYLDKLILNSKKFKISLLSTE